MVKKQICIGVLFIIFSSIYCMAAELTINDLYGTWQITNEDGSNPLKWEEFYKFNKDGTLDYMVNNNSRNYKFKLKNGELIINREFGSLRRTVKEYNGNKIVLYDKTLDGNLILTKKN